MTELFGLSLEHSPETSGAVVFSKKATSALMTSLFALVNLINSPEILSAISDNS
jgi:hypothetical protein